jgi:hypothetical protein
MGDIGEERREVEFEPLPETAPAQQPEPEPARSPEPAPTQAPA